MSAEPMKKIILYGIGVFCERFLSIVGGDPPFELLACCDSNPARWGQRFYGVPVIAPEELASYPYDKIVITTVKYAQEITERLSMALHIPVEKIAVLSEAEVDRLEREQFLREARETAAPKAWLFCAPDYGNLGDHAIADAEHRFFKSAFGLELVEVPAGRYSICGPLAKGEITTSDLVLITGGGFLGSLWTNMNRLALEAVASCPENRIIILPQTLYWEETPEGTAEREESQAVFSSHPTLTLCARDRESARLMREIYPGCHVELLPDMVLSCDWEFSEAVARRGILLCLRADKESVLTEEARQSLLKWVEGTGREVHSTDTRLDKWPVPRWERDVLLDAKLREFRSSELVVTDRLHGLLFSVITGTPCIALNNRTHKLRETFRWVREVPNIRFAASVEEVGALASEVIGVPAVWKGMPERFVRVLEPLLRDGDRRMER